METTTNSSLLYFELVNFLGHRVLARSEHFRTRVAYSSLPEFEIVWIVPSGVQL